MQYEDSPGGPAGMGQDGDWGPQNANKGTAGPNKMPTPATAIKKAEANPHIGKGKGERLKGHPFVGI